MKKHVRKEPLAKVNIRTGDDVIVITGKNRDRTKVRKVLKVLTAEGKVVVEGVNVVKDTVKPRGNARPSGINEAGIVEKALPIDASNVQLVDPKTGKATRIRLVKDAAGRRQRVSVKSGETIG